MLARLDGTTSVLQTPSILPGQRLHSVISRNSDGPAVAADWALHIERREPRRADDVVIPTASPIALRVA